MDIESLGKKLEANWLEQAKAPLVTIEDCYEALDTTLPNQIPTFPEIQQAYRHQLYKYNPDKPDLTTEAMEYKTLMTEKVKQAYRRICDALGKDPEAGLRETEESLIAERNRLLEGWAGHWCGTPSMYIEEEYKERIKALKDKGTAELDKL